MILVILKIILYVLLAVIGLILLLLALRIGFSVRVSGESRRIFVHAGFLKIDASRFTGKKRKIKIKKQSLAKYLKEKAKNDTAQSILQTENNGEPQKNGASRVTEEKNVAESRNNVNPTENSAFSGAKIKNGHLSAGTAQNKTSSGEENFGQISDEDNTEENSKSFFEMFSELPVTELLSLIKDTLKELREPFGRYARLRIRKLNIVISTPDAANTAIIYGTASLAYQTLIDVCGGFKFFKIKQKNCGVYYDFSKTVSTVLCDIKFTMAVWQIILCLLPVIKSYFRFRKISQKERNV